MSSTIFYYDKVQVRGPMLHDRHMQVSIKSVPITYQPLLLLLLFKKSSRFSHNAKVKSNQSDELFLVEFKVAILMQLNEFLVNSQNMCIDLGGDLWYYMEDIQGYIQSTLYKC